MADSMYYTYENTNPRPAGKMGGKGVGQESNVLLCSIEDMTYPVSIDVRL